MSNTITITAATGEDMQALGERLAKLARGGDVLLLSGPLGAGKTTFAQGFGAGLGIGEPIVSPTFTIARELEGRFADGSPAHLVHVDATGSAATPTRPDRTRSDGYWTNWNRSAWTRNWRIRASIPSS